MHKSVIGILLLAYVPLTSAASCRAATAADAGSQAGYDTAKKAADAWAQNEDQVAKSLGECLGDISTQILMPQFPSLTSVLGQIEKEVCRAAQSEINQYVPSTINPWENMPEIPDIHILVSSQQATRQVSLPAVATPVPVPAPAAPAVTGPVTDSPNDTVFSLN
ncbi:hypothetical protein ACU60T_23495 [Klebsiella aerogenes]